MNVRYHLDAMEEYDRAVSYYAAFNPGLAASLIGEVEKCIERISQNPLQGTELSPNIRAMQTRIFPYRLIYLIERDAITIVAVAHEKREPSYWTSRVN